jgi:hypothetical protein
LIINGQRNSGQRLHRILRAEYQEKFADPSKAIIVADHFTPSVML